MTQPGNPYETTPINTQTTIQTTPAPTIPPEGEKKSGSGGKIARRALLAGVGIGACVAGVELAPTAMKKLGEYTQAEVQDAFSAGVDSGRKAILDELSQIEGLTIDGAIATAELTRLAVKFIVLPLSRLVSTIEGGALDVLYNALQSAKDNLAKINVHISQLDGIEQMVGQWRDAVNQLPTTLDKYANADIDSAESYLKALQKRIAHEKQPSL
jgi:methyl-accepting chemotaxis protein